MYIGIVMIPLISSIGAGLFGRFIGTKGAGLLATTSIGITALLSWIIGYKVITEDTIIYTGLIGRWIESGILSISMGIRIDSITAMMLILVTTVSWLVHMYSTGYMSEDPHVPRFMAYLSLFTFFMVVLVTGDNLIQLFIGWEGVGLCSYLLINFWYTRIQANKSAIKAMIMNRIGDLGLTLGILATYYTFGATDYSTIFALASSAKYETTIIAYNGMEVYNLTLIGILFLIGAIGKSAQLGLHTWLPSAMEGPTPVSALIHAATMVTAGIFLLIRSSPILELSSTALFYITIIGALTALFAASVAIVQNDLKKVIAYSTCSQLGYMAFACGLSNYSVSLFHLFNHGFFKALLFLSAGSVLHALADEQDLRKMGALIYSLPFTYSMMTIGSLSLMGFPFLTGFYSKDLILELAYAHFSFHGTFAHWLGTLAASLTAFYSFRLIYLAFINTPNSSLSHFSHSHEPVLPMMFPLAFLAFCSIFVGYLFKDLFVGLGSPFFSSAIFAHPSHPSPLESEFIPSSVKLLPLIFSMLGVGVATFLYPFYSSSSWVNPIFSTPLALSIHSFLSSSWHIDWLYNETFGKPFLHFGHIVSYKAIDRGLLESLGPNGLSSLFSSSAKVLSSLQSGYLYHYAFVIFAATTLFFALSLFSSLTLSLSLPVLFLIPLLCLFV
uniref:NADH-ubiquinone oxidoreductase chain 5 n=1 Tax=Amoebidium parasiticum TaxID=4881 RepID=Q8M0B8_AMOPA|nr:NADH dehydrogenase subunit 5 [Amoebidium parasiticum]